MSRTHPTSEQFNEWFGQSVIRDSDGQPLVMYHGTYSQMGGGQQRNIDAFDREWSKRVRSPSIDNIGIWLSDNPGDGGAAQYGDTIYPVYSSAKRLAFYPSHQALCEAMHEAANPGVPIDRSKPIGLGDVEPLRNQLIAMGYDGIGIDRPEVDAMLQNHRDTLESYDRARAEEAAARRPQSGIPASELPIYAAKVQRLKEAHYTAARECSASGIDIATGRSEFGEQNCVIIFDPAHVKSAISAIDFDKSNAFLADRSQASIDAEIRLYCSQRAPEQNQGFMEWFGNSAAVDNNGKPLLLYHGTHPERDIFNFHMPHMESTVCLTPDLGLAECFTNHPMLEEGSRGSIYPVYASLKNPYIVHAVPESDEWEEFFEIGSRAAELKAKGFDGAMIYDLTTQAYDQIVCFYPDQLKSAISATRYAQDNAYLSDRDEQEIRADIQAFCQEAAERRAQAQAEQGHSSREQALSDWMAGSPMVDASGAPLVLYHGTTADLDSFSLAYNGSDGTPYSVPGIFATDSTVLASDYACQKNDRRIADAIRVVQRFKNANPGVYDDEYEEAYKGVKAAFKSVREENSPERGGGANVIPVHMNLQHPLRVDGQGQLFMEVIPAAMKKAVAQGHDGLVISNVIDHASDTSKFPTNVYVALRPESVKSAVSGMSFDKSSALLSDRTNEQVTADIRAHCDLLRLESRIAVANAVLANGYPIELQQASDLVRGCTAKPNGVDPLYFLQQEPRQGRILALTHIPLTLIRANEAGERYDGTVNLDRAVAYAALDKDEAPPIILQQSRRGSLLNVIDGGHRVSAARLRNDTHITALATIWSPELLRAQASTLHAQHHSGDANGNNREGHKNREAETESKRENQAENFSHK